MNSNRIPGGWGGLKPTAPQQQAITPNMYAVLHRPAGFTHTNIQPSIPPSSPSVNPWVRMPWST